MLCNKSDVSVSNEVLAQIQTAIAELLKEPLPPYCTLGIQLIVHAGSIKRLKITKDIQKEIEG